MMVLGFGGFLIEPGGPVMTKWDTLYQMINKLKVVNMEYKRRGVVLVFPWGLLRGKWQFLTPLYWISFLILGKQFMMHHLMSKLSWSAFSSAGAIFRNPPCFSMITKQYFTTISALQRKFQDTRSIAIHCTSLNTGSLRFSKPLSFAAGFIPLQRKLLESILDVERAKNKPSKELADIWADYHFGRGHIELSMKAKLYYLLEQRKADCWYFVIPLWKGSGYTTMFMQAQMLYMLSTGLADYKARGKQVSPFFIASYYKDFADNKDLVLIECLWDFF